MEADQVQAKEEKGRKLTAKQAQFCQHVIATGGANICESARAAGYKSAHQGYENIKKHHIHEALIGAGVLADDFELTGGVGIYEAAREKGDLPTALKALEFVAKLRGKLIFKTQVGIADGVAEGLARLREKRRRAATVDAVDVVEKE